MQATVNETLLLYKKWNLFYPLRNSENWMGQEQEDKALLAYCIQYNIVWEQFLIFLKFHSDLFSA